MFWNKILNAFLYIGHPGVFRYTEDIKRRCNITLYKLILSYIWRQLHVSAIYMYRLWIVSILLIDYKEIFKIVLNYNNPSINIYTPSYSTKLIISPTALQKTQITQSYDLLEKIHYLTMYISFKWLAAFLWYCRLVLR